MVAAPAQKSIVARMAMAEPRTVAIAPLVGSIMISPSAVVTGMTGALNAHSMSPTVARTSKVSSSLDWVQVQDGVTDPCMSWSTQKACGSTLLTNLKTASKLAFP